MGIPSLEQGWCVIPSLVSPETVRALDADFARDLREHVCNGGFYGARSKRFGRLLARSALSKRLVQHPLVLGISRRVLGPWCDTIQLNLTQALALHPGAPPQLPHRDQDMWRGAIGEIEYLVNVMWPFTRYTRENGATVVWPKSHGRHALDPHPPAGEFPVELEPGSALLFLGSTLHGAGGNASDEVRRGGSSATAWDGSSPTRTSGSPTRRRSRAASALNSPPSPATQHRPNLGNDEGQCPSVLLDGDMPSRLAATDALRPDQEELVAEFVRNQNWPAASAAA